MSAIGVWLSARFARAVDMARPRAWGLSVAALVLVTTLLTFHTLRNWGPVSDGAYNWIFSRSLAYDHDIEFTNDYALCGDPAGLGRVRGGGHPDDPFYVGPSLFWVPAIEVARAVYRFPPEASEAMKLGCKGPIARVALSTACFATALLVFLSYCAARRLGSDFVAALTAGLFAFGTTLGVYATGAASYSHVYDGACVAALLVLSLRAYERPERWVRWGFAGVALSACILHRLTNGPLGLLPAAFAFTALVRRPRRLAGALFALTVPAVVFGIVPELLIYKYLYGHYWFVPQGPYFFQPAHAHPWLLLFSPKGLFFLAPVAWLSFLGALASFRAAPARPLLLTVLGMFAVEHFIAASALDWDASSSLGARRLVSLFPLLIFLATPAVAKAEAWVSFKPNRVRGLLVAALFVPMGMVFFGTQLEADTMNNYDYYPSPAAMYGGGFGATLEVLDRYFGAIADLPGQLFFYLRYRVPHAKYFEATQLTFYRRDQWSMRISNARLDLVDPHLQAALVGFHREAHKAPTFDRRATLVFCAEWHYATTLEVIASADKPTDLRVSRRTVFGSTIPFGTVSLTEDEATFRLAIPPGGYDSGIEELVFETAGGSGASVRQVELLDENEYPPFP